MNINKEFPNKEVLFEEIVNEYSVEIRDVAKGVRRKLYDIMPGLTECVWKKQKIAGYGTGPKKMSEHFCWIKAAKGHVTLGFNYGAELPDPSGILEGTGKMFRHVKIRAASDLESESLIELVTFASTHRVPPLKT